MSFLPQKANFRQRSNVFSPTRILHFQDEKYRVEDIRGFVT